MKTVLSFILLLFLSSLPSYLLAQTESPCSVKLSPIEKKEKKSFNFHKLLPASEGKILSVAKANIKSRNTNIYLELKAKDARTIVEKTIDLTYKKHKTYFLDILEFQKKWYVLSDFYSKKGKRKQLIARELDKVSLELKGTAILLGESHCFVVNGYESFRSMLWYSFHYDLSPDKNKLLVYSNFYNKKDKTLNYAINVWDEKFKVQWTKSGIYKANRIKNIRHVDGLVNNIGDVFLYQKNSKEKTKESNKKDWWAYKVYCHTASGATKKILPVDLPESGFISDFKLKALNNGTILGAGYYSKKNGNHLSGSFSFKIDPNILKISNFRQAPLSQDILAKSSSSKKRENKGKDLELWNYSLKEMLESTNGDIFVLGGFETASTPSSARGSNSISNTLFYSGNILVEKLNSKNQKNWTTIIEKDARSKLYFHHAFKVFLTKDQLYCFYNTDATNKTKSLMLTALDEKGKATDWEIYTNRVNKVTPNPSSMVFINSKKINFYSQYGYTKHALGKIIMKDMHLYDEFSQ